MCLHGLTCRLVVLLCSLRSAYPDSSFPFSPPPETQADLSLTSNLKQSRPSDMQVYEEDTERLLGH